MFIKALCSLVTSFLKSRSQLALENTLLRYQLGVLNRSQKRLYFKRWDRPIIVWLSQRIPNWKDLILIVRPETIIRWHQKGFALYWGWRFSKKAGGRRSLHPSAINLIKEISRVNPLWGAPRIHGELLKLGVKVSQASVEKYRVRRRGPNGQNWKSFLNNHMNQTVAIDFFVVPTIRFRMLWTLVVLSHDRRKILHTAITHKPSGAWTVQQLRNAFAFQEFPKYILHDRDHNFLGLSKLGIEEVVTSFRSPWQNAFVERVIGSIRRECTDHLIVFNEKHLEKILSKYREYYNCSRTHLSLNKDSPNTRAVISVGKIKVIPKVNGLHHEFSRVAA